MSTQNIRYRLCGVVSNGRVLVNSKKPQETRNLVIPTISSSSSFWVHVKKMSSPNRATVALRTFTLSCLEILWEETIDATRNVYPRTAEVWHDVPVFERNIRVLFCEWGYARTPRTRRPKSRTRRCMFTTAILRFNNIAKHFKSEEFRIIFDSDVTCVLVRSGDVR